MPRRRLTRREAIKTGALGALTVGLLKPGPAIAAPAGLVELSVGLDAPTDAAVAAGWRTSEVLRAPRRFDVMGVAWRRGTPEVEIRARRGDGSWTRWLRLSSDAGHAPDGETPHGTEPAFTGAADYLQVRVRGRAEGLRARMVRAQPTARVAGRLSSRRARAAQAPGAPQIIPRERWGAATVPPRAQASYGEVRMAFIHHTATGNDYSPDEAAGIVLGIARYHRDSNKWNDVGYNFLVDKHGQIFEGRAGGIDQAVIGAQAQGYNSVSTGIACLGDHTTIAQSPAAIEAIARLLAWKLPLHQTPVAGQVTVESAGGPTNRYRDGSTVTFERISGHRDGNKTSCPGAMLYGQLAEIRTRTARYAPPVEVTSVESSLSLRAAQTTLKPPAPAELSGILRLPDVGPLSGFAIRVEFRDGADSPWQGLGTVPCGSDGAWQLSVALPNSGQLRAVFDGNGFSPPLASAETSVTVVPRLTLNVSTQRLKAGGRLRIAGDCAPAPQPRPRVELLVERRTESGWVRVRARRIPVRRGRYELRLRLPVRGMHRLTVTMPGASAREWLRVTA